MQRSLPGTKGCKINCLGNLQEVLSNLHNSSGIIIPVLQVGWVQRLRGSSFISFQSLENTAQFSTTTQK